MYRKDYIMYVLHKLLLLRLSCKIFNIHEHCNETAMTVSITFDTNRKMYEDTSIYFVEITVDYINKFQIQILIFAFAIKKSRITLYIHFQIAFNQ